MSSITGYYNNDASNNLRGTISRIAQFTAPVLTFIVVFPYFLFTGETTQEYVVGLLSSAQYITTPLSNMISMDSEQAQLIALFFYMCSFFSPFHAVRLTFKALRSVVYGISNILVSPSRISYTQAVMFVMMCFSAYAMYTYNMSMSDFLHPLSPISRVVSGLFDTPADSDKRNTWMESIMYIFSMSSESLKQNIDNFNGYRDMQDKFTGGLINTTIANDYLGETKQLFNNVIPMDISSNDFLSDQFETLQSGLQNAGYFAAGATTAGTYFSPTLIPKVIVGTVPFIPKILSVAGMTVGATIQNAELLTLIGASGLVILEQSKFNYDGDDLVPRPLEMDWSPKNNYQTYNNNNYHPHKSVFQNQTNSFWSMFSAKNCITTGTCVLMGILKARIDSYINNRDQPKKEIKKGELDLTIDLLESSTQFGPLRWVHKASIVIIRAFCKLFNAIIFGTHLPERLLEMLPSFFTAENVRYTAIAIQMSSLTTLYLSLHGGSTEALGYIGIAFFMSEILGKFIEVGVQITANTTILLSDIALILMETTHIDIFDPSRFTVRQNPPRAIGGTFRQIQTSSRFITKTAMRFCDFGHISLYRNAASTSKKYKSQ
jgi:hypothetical protein